MNEHIQRAVGEIVENKPPGMAPDLRPLFGRWMRLEPVSAEKHAHGSLRFLQGQRSRRHTSGPIWAMGLSPISRVSDRGFSSARLSRDPWFYAYVRRDTGKAAGMGAFMRLDAPNGVIEIGHIWMSPGLQNTREATDAIFLMMRHAFDELGVGK